MNDSVLTDAEKLAADAKAKSEADALAIDNAAKDRLAGISAETEANIATAKERVHGLGHDIEAVAHWLVATTGGAIKDVGDAIRWIGSNL